MLDVHEVWVGAGVPQTQGLTSLYPICVGTVSFILARHPLLPPSSQFLIVAVSYRFPLGLQKNFRAN